MKKILFAVSILFVFTNKLFAQDGRIGINIDEPMATLHIHGTLRFGSPYVSLSPTYVLTLDNVDSNIHKLSVDSLNRVLGNSIQTHPDIVGWGKHIFNPLSAGIPPKALYRDQIDKLGLPQTHSQYLNLQTGVLPIQERDLQLDWPVSLSDFNAQGGAVFLGGYLYIGMIYGVTAENRIYRYDKNNINAGGTRISFSGLALSNTNNEIIMTSDGKDFFFSYNAGNSPNDNVIAKYSMSGTVFTYISSATVGSVGDFSRSFLVDTNGNYYGLSVPGNIQLKKFSPTGALLYTITTPAQYLLNWSNDFYSSGIGQYYFEKFNK